MAAAKKGGLGKGIDSLIPNKVSATKTEAKNENVKNDKVIEGVLVNINKVEPNREQPRKNFDEDALLELSESIKQFGRFPRFYRCQMSSLYCAIVRSEEKNPALLMLMSIFFAHAMRSS